jgi:PAS domain S-box-containing protein
MKTDKDVSGIFELRKRAEIALRDRREEGEEFSSLYPEAKDNLIHELQVYQIELEMQNDELRRVQGELEKARDRYSHLYDFAPVGYFTLSEKGIIEEVNLTLASMLGTDRSALIGKPFTRHILRDDQDIFYKLRHRLLETEKSQTCELRLVKKNGDEYFANLECMVLKNRGDDSRFIRMAVTDITERKKMDRKLQNAHDKLEEQVEERTAELRRALSFLKSKR